MRTITNDYKDAQILNLGSEGERGPYLVTQTGVAPSDPRLKTCMFVLRPDGHWVDFNAYACQGKPEAIDEIVFPSTTKVMERFGKLFGQPRVLDLPIDEAGLNAWIERHRAIHYKQFAGGSHNIKSAIAKILEAKAAVRERQR
jgi:hypothetical protein